MSHENATPHPSSDLLRQFVNGCLPGALNRRIVSHLLGGCPSCRTLTSSHWHGSLAEHSGEPPTPGDELSDGTDTFRSVLAEVRSRQELLSRQRSQVPPLLEELESHPPARRKVLIRNSERFHTWALCETLLERSREASGPEPDRGVELAELAVAVSEGLEGSTYGDTLVNELRGRALARLGAAHRRAGDLDAAEGAFAAAAGLFQQGTGDPVESADFQLHLALLRLAQDRSEEAGELARRALRSCEQVSDEHLVGRGLVLRGIVLAREGTTVEAIETLRRALTVLEPARDVRLSLAANHNLALLLHRQGSFSAAQTHLELVRPLYSRHGDARDGARRAWLEGRLVAALGQAGEAASLLREARTALLGEEGTAPLLLSLELARIHAEDGDREGVRDALEPLIRGDRRLPGGRATASEVRALVQASRRRGSLEALIQQLRGLADGMSADADLVLYP